MSIIYNGSISPLSAVLTDGIADSANNQVYIVESTLPSFRKYDLTLFTQTGSSTCLAGPGAICLINGASAVIASTSVTTVDFIETATNYRQNYAGGSTLASTGKNQRIAADTALGIGFYVTSTANRVTKFTNAFAISNLTINGAPNFIPASIILKTSGRWLVGGRFGHIYEIDSNGVIYDELIVQLNPNSGVLNSTSLGNLAISSVSAMSYDNNLLLVSTEHCMALYDYSTKTKLWQVMMTDANNQPQSIVLSNPSSGESLMTWANATNTVNNVTLELDFTVSPVQAQDCLFTDSVGKVVTTGFNPTTALGFALQSTVERIRVFSVTPRATTTRAFVANPGGINQKARLILIDDTGGVGTAFIVLDTYMQSPATYRVPTGRNIIEVMKVGEGVNASFSYSRYTT